MSREGSMMGLLHGLHADSCDGQEYSACRPVVVPEGGSEEPNYYDGTGRGARIEVVIMAWCGECNAAEWGVV